MAPKFVNLLSDRALTVPVGRADRYVQNKGFWFYLYTIKGRKECKTHMKRPFSLKLINLLIVLYFFILISGMKV